MREHAGRDVSEVRRNQILKGLGSHNQEAGVILKKKGKLWKCFKTGGEGGSKMRQTLEEDKVEAIVLI